MEFESFAQRILHLRLARGLSERQLAERMGITVHRYQSFAGTGASPTWVMLLDLAGALEVPVGELTAFTRERLPSSDALDSRAALMSAVERGETLRALSSRYARLVLDRCEGNKRQACRVLGISYHTLRVYLRYRSDSNDGDRVPESLG